MSLETIKNLDELIANSLKNNEKILSTDITRLTKPGENYGSIMLRVDIKIKNETTKAEKVLNAVAKLIPDNELILKIFNTQVTYKNELEFYRTIVPTLQEFQREHGVKDVINCVAKFIGGRINLNPNSKVVDKNAVIMLENLKVQGYQSLERTAGYDFKTAKVVIKEMSTLHAVPLAVKIQKPEIFESKIKPYLKDFMADKIPLDNIKADIKAAVHDVDLIKKAFAAIEKPSDKSVREPWGTLLQNDFWISNTLVKFIKDEPVNAKIVDFQICEYKSPLRDLIFFLFTSVKIEVLEEHLDDLLDFYYLSFTEKLIQMKVDTKPFSRQSFNKELRLSASMSEFFHVLWMLGIVHATEDDIKESSDFTQEDFEKPKHITELYKASILFITKECAKRGWI